MILLVFIGLIFVAIFGFLLIVFLCPLIEIVSNKAEIFWKNILGD